MAECLLEWKECIRNFIKKKKIQEKKKKKYKNIKKKKKKSEEKDTLDIVKSTESQRMVRFWQE